MGASSPVTRSFGRVLCPFSGAFTGRIAQRSERLLYTQEVGGSIPSSPTTVLTGRRLLAEISTAFPVQC